MRKTTILLLFVNVLFSSINIKAQTLNPTHLINAAGSADTFVGGYTFSYTAAGTPWNGSLISFGGLSNGYDCQINADYQRNRISFRTKNGDLHNWNSWNELATLSGENNFTGNQNIGGSLGISTTNLTSQLTVGDYHGIKLSVGGGTTWMSKNILQTSWTSGVGDFTEIKVVGKFTNNASLRLIENGNVGIGVTYPTNKLDVNGTIHSKEVKVDMIGWSDFVFKKEYELPTLQEVEKHINEKGHLENIPNEEEVLKNGINLGEMNSKLLQKIEELTLYAIDQKKKSDKQSEEIEILKKENEAFKSVFERLYKLEQKIK